MKFKKHLKIILNILSLWFKGKKIEARREALTEYSYILKKIYKFKKLDGIDVINEKWDYLIILDACRYDYFEMIFKKYLVGKLEKKISKGSNTSEWLLNNFNNYYEDTIYISANPHCSDYEVDGFTGTDHFFKVENVWKNEWDEELDTVHPKKVVKAALKSIKLYPNKRAIIHFIQPHGPWIGKTKININDKSSLLNEQKADSIWNFDTYVWNLAKDGRFNIEEIKMAFVDNLEFVMPYVKELIDKLGGRIIITADHGEAFGEKFVFEHPSHMYTKELVEIPWLVIEKEKRDSNSSRPNINKDDENQITRDKDEEIIAKRLKALGYM